MKTRIQKIKLEDTHAYKLSFITSCITIVQEQKEYFTNIDTILLDSYHTRLTLSSQNSNIQLMRKYLFGLEHL